MLYFKIHSHGVKYLKYASNDIPVHVEGICLHMYTCIHVYIYIYIDMYVYIHNILYVNVYLCINPYIHLRIYILYAYAHLWRPSGS